MALDAAGEALKQLFLRLAGEYCLYEEGYGLLPKYTIAVAYGKLETLWAVLANKQDLLMDMGTHYISVLLSSRQCYLIFK